MIERESRKKNRYDLLNVIIKIDDHYSKNFSIKLLAKCIILSLCSQELRDSSGLRYVLGNKCCMMFLNTLIKFMEELGFYKMNFKIILKTVVMKCIMFLEICKILKTNTMYINKKKIVSVESLKSNLEFNDDFRFQRTKYSVYQNLVCEYEELELNDLVIVCEMYEFNQPFLIKNIKNISNSRNDLTDIFELINNESIVDVKYYEESLNESIKDKLKIIDKIRSSNVDNCEQKIKNIERLILKKKKFLEIIKVNNRIFFMKKICFRSRFYDISELGVTNSKEIRYAIKYENFSINDVNNKIMEIKNTIYYNKIKEYFGNLTLREYYLEKFKDFDKNGVLAICLCIIVTIGMEFKNEMIKNNILTRIENFIEIGEK
jgi:hypothetical protein